MTLKHNTDIDNCYKYVNIKKKREKKARKQKSYFWWKLFDQIRATHDENVGHVVHGANRRPGEALTWVVDEVYRVPKVSRHVLGRFSENDLNCYMLVVVVVAHHQITFNKLSLIMFVLHF